MRIELRQVSRRFGKLVALNGLDLEIASGRRVALIGPNGSGKSTLTRVLAGMLSCEGDVRVGGLSPLSDRRRLAPRLVYVPQAAPQLGATVREIVQAVASVRRMDPAQIERVGERLDLRIAEVADKPVRTLSGGMKQKLLLAMAFAADAGLVLLDEPTASLDAGTRKAFYKLAAERSNEATVLLCSHRLEEVRHLVDTVVALEDGRLAWQGSVSEFLARSSHALIEVRAPGAEASAWLAERGFQAGAEGAWSRVVVQARSVALLRDLLSGLNGSIDGVRVRDLDAVDSTAGASVPDEGGPLA